MNRHAEMIGLMGELYGEPETLRGRKSRAGRITPDRARLYRLVNKALRAGTIQQTDCSDCGAYSQHARGLRQAARCGLAMRQLPHAEHKR